MTLLPRSGKAAIRKGKGDKARMFRSTRPGATRWMEFGQRSLRDQSFAANAARYLLAVLGRRADVAHVHPHRFRHDAARRLIAAVDLPTVAALLGHSRLDTVRIYAQPDEAALQRAVETLESR
jgi:integrase